mmetsp:Transcript_18266/g.70587  ORF Transcript_18266/g.70587 Transcript_18266/m.70587 type:complete len:203 (-) Transcript_18266:245-853(-)
MAGRKSAAEKSRDHSMNCQSMLTSLSSALMSFTARAYSSSVRTPSRPRGRPSCSQREAVALASIGSKYGSSRYWRRSSSLGTVPATPGAASTESVCKYFPIKTFFEEFFFVFLPMQGHGPVSWNRSASPLGSSGHASSLTQRASSRQSSCISKLTSIPRRARRRRPMNVAVNPQEVGSFPSSIPTILATRTCPTNSKTAAAA